MELWFFTNTHVLANIKQLRLANERAPAKAKTQHLDEAKIVFEFISPPPKKNQPNLSTKKILAESKNEVSDRRLCDVRCGDARSVTPEPIH